MCSSKAEGGRRCELSRLRWNLARAKKSGNPERIKRWRDELDEHQREQELETQGSTPGPEARVRTGVGGAAHKKAERLEWYAKGAEEMGSPDAAARLREQAKEVWAEYEARVERAKGWREIPAEEPVRHGPFTLQRDNTRVWITTPYNKKIIRQLKNHRAHWVKSRGVV